MNDTGWIKLHRSILDWEWFSQPSTAHFFIYCLLKANHEDVSWRGMNIRCGSFVSTRNMMSDETGLTEQAIRTSINRLRMTNNILVESTSKYTIITICKYEDYQKNILCVNQPTTNQQPTNNQPTTNQQPTNNQPTTNQQPTHINRMNKNNKKERNKERKKISSSSSFAVDEKKENSENVNEKIDYKKITSLWNEKMNGCCGKLISIENRRREYTNERISRYGIGNFIEAIDIASKSDYLTQSPWFNYDWFVKPNNFDKVISGNYNDNKNAKGNGSEDDNRLCTADEFGE